MCKHPTEDYLDHISSKRWGTPPLRVCVCVCISLESFLGHVTFQEGFEGSTVVEGGMGEWGGRWQGQGLY